MAVDLNEFWQARKDLADLWAAANAPGADDNYDSLSDDDKSVVDWVKSFEGDVNSFAKANYEADPTSGDKAIAAWKAGGTVVPSSTVTTVSSTPVSSVVSTPTSTPTSNTTSSTTSNTVSAPISSSIISTPTTNTVSAVDSTTTNTKPRNPATNKPWTSQELQQAFSRDFPSGVTAAHLTAFNGDFGAFYNDWAGKKVGGNGQWDDTGTWSGWGGYVGSWPKTGTGGTDDTDIAGKASNFFQNQTGNQGGTFSTTGTTGFDNLVTNSATTSQTTDTTNLASSVTSSTNSQNQRTDTGQDTTSQTDTRQTGTVGTIGTVDTKNDIVNRGVTTTGVQDTLGFGELLKGQTGVATEADAARQGFLSDLVTTGGNQLNSQVEQAVRNSLTGPQITGSGESARARAAGYAAAEMGRRNTENRLAAANQLAGPTAVQTLVGAGTPFLGKTEQTTGTQTNTGRQDINQTQTTDMTTGSRNIGTSRGWQDLYSNALNTGGTTSGGTQTSNVNANTGSTQAATGSQTENQAGSASGSSSQNASGLLPQAQQVSTGGGGCIVCTAGLHHGLWRRPRLLRRVTSYKIQQNWARFRYAARGYFFLFGPIAKAALRYRWVSRITMPIANSVVYEEARLAGVKLKFRAVPWALHWTWHGLCSIVGRFPVRNHVADKDLLTVAKKYNVFFNVGA